MSESVQEEKERSLASLDEEDLSDADELHRKAKAMREDEYFDVPVVDWEKTDGRRGEKVEVTFVRPNGERKTIELDWPEKPTGESTFIRMCMVALDIDEPKDAALMADELQEVPHDDFTVPADVTSSGEWSLVPEADDNVFLGSLRRRVHGGNKEDEDVGLDVSFKMGMFLSGPVSLVVLSLFGVLSEPGEWFDSSKTGAETYWFAQSLFYSMIGTISWLMVTGLLLL